MLSSYLIYGEIFFLLRFGKSRDFFYFLASEANKFHLMIYKLVNAEYLRSFFFFFFFSSTYLGLFCSLFSSVHVLMCRIFTN